MSQTLTKRKKAGYAFGIFTESLLYNMFYTYYLTFLNEIVGIQPKYSSMIIFISIAWDAVTDPMIGSYSDRPGVDKRKLMNKAIVPMAVFFILAWTSLGRDLFEAQWAKIIFYVVVTMCIWIFYTMYTIPYYAVVAELTEDYDERTQIRSNASLVNAGAIGLGNILPALVPTVMIYVGKDNAYAAIAALVSVMAIIFGFICTKSLKGVYHPKPMPENGVVKGGTKETFKAFGQILKMKPAAIFLVFVFFFLAGSSMIQSNLTYMVVDCIGMNYDDGIAIVILSLVVSMAVVVPIVEKTAEKTDRRTACIIFFIIAIAGEVICKIVGLDVTVGNFKIMTILCPVLLGIGGGTFWTLFYSMGYDLVELDEFKTGKRRESIITALPQLIQKFGSAFGILMAGQFLSAYGYDSSADVTTSEKTVVQLVTDPKIIDGMENISTIIPAALIGVSLIALIIYPMTRKRVNALMEQLSKKRAGKSYTTEGFEKLL